MKGLLIQDNEIAILVTAYVVHPVHEAHRHLLRFQGADDAGNGSTGRNWSRNAIAVCVGFDNPLCCSFALDLTVASPKSATVRPNRNSYSTTIPRTSTISSHSLPVTPRPVPNPAPPASYRHCALPCSTCHLHPRRASQRPCRGP